MFTTCCAAETKASFARTRSSGASCRRGRDEILRRGGDLGRSFQDDPAQGAHQQGVVAPAASAGPPGQDADFRGFERAHIGLSSDVE